MSNDISGIKAYMEKFKFIPLENLSSLPDQAGVYSFCANKSALYIGKAISIRKRVKSHFNQPNFKDSLFLKEAEKIGYIATDSEIEALILEARLIKKIQPKYNVIWKDDKHFFFVAISKGPLSYFSITHQPKAKGFLHIGPFTDGWALKQALKILRKIFPYYIAKKHPKGPCQYCHLGLCPGPNPNIKEYKKTIFNLKKFLLGEKKSVVKMLKREMDLASRMKNFEKAAELRDKIFYLENVLAHKKIFSKESWPSSQLKELFSNPLERIEGYDISNIQGKEAVGSMVVFIKGRPEKSLYRKFRIKTLNTPNDTAMIKEVLSRRLKHKEWDLPSAVLIDGGKGQLNAALSILGDSKIIALALAKRNSELYLKDRKVLLESLPKEVSDLILQVRDESHRFAQSYHHKLRALTFN